MKHGLEGTGAGAAPTRSPAHPRVLDLGDVREPVMVFGGVYSNLEALRRILDRAAELAIAPARMIHGGDIIAYGADPAACAQRLRELACPAIAGNVEQQLHAGAPDCGCGFEDGSGCDLLSARWYAFARERVSGDLRAWMGTLPDHLVFRAGGVSVRVVHASPLSPNRFLYGPEPDADFAGELAAVPEQVIVCGHSGFPFVRRFGARVWVNTGAAGLPADDGTPRGWYAVLTPHARGLTIAIEGLNYDHEAAAAKLIAAGLPQPYATALRGGPRPIATRCRGPCARAPDRRCPSTRS